MFYTTLTPVNRCIITDLLPAPKYPEYTSGLLLSIDNIHGDFEVVCSILNTGMNGKYVNKPSIVKIRTPPFLSKDLIQTGVYGKCNGFLLVDTSIRSYLDMSNIDFLNEIYAKIYAINRTANNFFRTNVIINNNAEVKNFFTMYNEANKITNKTLDTLVNSEEKRKKLIYNVLLIESFIKKYLPKPLDIMQFVQKTLYIAKDYQQEEAIKKLTTILASKKSIKLLNDLQEITDVLHRYKNSGYWL